MPRASTIASAGVSRRWISMQRSTSSPTASRYWRTVSMASPHLGDVGLEVGHAARLVEERRQVADGGEALLLGLDAALDQLLAWSSPKTW